MSSTRRSFLKTTFAASATTAAFAVVARASTAEKSPAPMPAVPARDFYELRSYRLKPGASSDLLEAYLADALLPALNARGLAHVGVFTEVDVDKKAVTATPKADSPVWVLINYPTLESFISVSADLNADATVQAAGKAYLKTPKATPAFDRLDTWLLRAFTGQPTLAVPSFAKAPTRIYEMRDYQSHSEERALSKMAMFNEGEIPLMRDLGMSPVFFGQAIAGRDLPHLRYITGAADLATHLGNWKKFGPDPRWAKMKDLPQYADNMSLNTARFIVPKSYSQI